ncbi:MAG: septum formation protein Maf [Lentisphaerae bacterium GWF2_49_21]|nr:MAG: septum formation protein Maf [Lentisphaerae bacterium GWF2_49_21]
MKKIPEDRGVPEIILASESPRRKEILSRMGIGFKSLTPSAEETNEYFCPSLVPLVNACRKAENISEAYPSSLVIGADTVIELDGKILGKPSSSSEARKMLLMLSGRKHLVLTGVCLVKKEVRAKCVFCDSTEVIFKKLSNPAVDDYIGKVNTLDKAGAYAIQEHGEMLIAGIEGSFDNVIGLPSEKLARALQSLALGRVIRNLVPEPKLSS